ncbi:MAG: hypothetical protein AAF211_09065, partial [Myxococcota bacterium]
MTKTRTLLLSLAVGLAALVGTDAHAATLTVDTLGDDPSDTSACSLRVRRWAASPRCRWCSRSLRSPGCR